MQLRQLEYLVALARERHFGRAATSCWVSQPTLSSGIRTLEAELGFAIVRHGQRYGGLTPEGERLVDFARRTLRDRDELLRDLGQGNGAVSGRLALGAIPTSLPPLPLLINPFRQRHPGVDVSVYSLSSVEIVRRLKTFDLDAGFTYLEGAVPTGIATRVLYDERYLLLASEDVLPDDRTVISWAEAAELPLCLLTPDMQNRRIIDGLFRRVKAQPAPKVETNSISALISHVRWGHCASVVPQSWLQPLGIPEGTRVLSFSGESRTSRVGLVWRDERRQPSLISALLEATRDLDVQATLDSVIAAGPPGTDRSR